MRSHDLTQALGGRGPLQGETKGMVPSDQPKKNGKTMEKYRKTMGIWQTMGKVKNSKNIWQNVETLLSKLWENNEENYGIQRKN